MTVSGIGIFGFQAENKSVVLVVVPSHEFRKENNEALNGHMARAGWWQPSIPRLVGV